MNSDSKSTRQTSPVTSSLASTDKQAASLSEEKTDKCVVEKNDVPNNKTKSNVNSSIDKSKNEHQVEPKTSKSLDDASNATRNTDTKKVDGDSAKFKESNDRMDNKVKERVSNAAEIDGLKMKKISPIEAEQLQHQDNASSVIGGDEGKTSPSTQSHSPPQIVVGAAGATIPDNILSPPKSETQTDGTNTTTSSSPASDSQLSPIAEVTISKSSPTATVVLPTPTLPPPTKVTPQSAPTTTGLSQPINIVANGTIPKSGKPLMSAMNKKINKPSRSVRPRKQKTLVAMYESEISDNKIGIKLCIKKSDTSGSSAATSTVVSPTASVTPSTTSKTSSSSAASSSKQIRKRSRKSKTRSRIDSDDSEYETKRKRDRTHNNGGNNQKKVSFSATANDEKREPIEQTEWGAKLPEEILFQIFRIATNKEGCLPTLLRLGRVCSLWRRVSLSPTLWKTMDLSTWIKEKYRTELKLKWFVDNRCSSCTELNVSNWKVSDINCFLTKLANGCPNLVGITLSGWKNFTSDHLTYLVDNMKKLERLDLSSINVEMNASKSAVGLQSLCNALQTMGKRLTHLYLAHNRLAGIPQIVTILSSYCPNLVLLDLSNVTTQATSHGILHIEKLQNGCQKLRVLRVTNSHVTLSTATMQETMDSLGFPDLEELSVAALTDESRVIGDEHLQRILKTSSKLKLLDVRGCTRLTHESLIRLPAWDIKHLFLSGCSVTRDVGSGLELIASKWAHSLIELDLAWANVQQPLDNALRSLAEKGSESPLAHLNLCGSSVSEDAVKEILAKCALMSSINLSSCRGLPRGVKRLMQGPQELQELREVLRVQMKVKLPSQLKREKEEQHAKHTDIVLNAEVDGDGAGGDTSTATSGNSQLG